MLFSFHPTISVPLSTTDALVSSASTSRARDSFWTVGSRQRLLLPSVSSASFAEFVWGALSARASDRICRELTTQQLLTAAVLTLLARRPSHPYE